MAFSSLSIANDDGIPSKKERKFVTKYMESSMDQLFNGIEDLNEAQWNFTPADGGWSVAGTCEHLLIAERGFYNLIEGRILTSEDNRAQPDELTSNEAVIEFIKDRSPSKRVKTPAPFEPTGAVKSPADFMEKYKVARQKLMDYIKTTEKELKSYYWESPAGKISAYQWLILASAHTERHFAQMQETMAEAGYPKVD